MPGETGVGKERFADDIHSYHLSEEIRKSVEGSIGGTFKTTGTLSEVLDRFREKNAR